MSKIYDSFLFFNELDILEMRLEILDPYVDYFIISECDYTFSGNKKPFYYEENRDKFKKYWDKIIHIKNFDSNEYLNPIKEKTGNQEIDLIKEGILNEYQIIQNSEKTDYGKPYWCREYLHREYVKIGMKNCLPSDIIIFSDVDEIPEPSKIIPDGKNYCFKQNNMIYYINKENVTEDWFGPVVTSFSYLSEKSLNSIRGERLSYNIIDGGWHLSFMGGPDRISDKIKSYSHQEFNNSGIHDNIQSRLDSNLDILHRNIRIENRDIDGFYPEKIISLVKNKYPYLIHD
jgi:beta-1,4-mannosyl-glycoprotein beta-1,4-N-acetylglucosaminyltransferase